MDQASLGGILFVMSQLDPSGSFYSNNPIDSERWVKVIAATSEYESLLERGIAPEIETFVDLYSDVPREILIAELRQLTQEYQQSLTPSGHDQVPVSGNQGGYSPSDRYSELEAIGYGGMGEIYRGLDQECSRFVAIKKLRQDHQRNPEAQKRFHTEAEITAGLEHPGIVPVYGKGVDPQGLEFYAMRLISGEGAGTLSDSIQKLHQQVSAEGHRWRATYLEQIRDLVRRLVTVCDTVAYAHSRGIVHRDLKPSNILIGPYGETLIADWGLARKIDPLDSVRSHPAPENRHGIEISTGGDTARAGDATSGIGTPGYSAPELAQSPQTHLLKSADIYSLGAILLCMLHGRNPGLMADSSSGPWSNNTFASLEAIGRKAMDADLSVRYSTVEDFRQDLLNCMAGEPVSAVPEGYWERAIRWPSRHRVAAAGLASATVIAILAGSLMVWLQAQQSRLNDSLQSQSRDILHFILNDLENEVSPSPSNLDRLSQTTHRLATMESSLGRHDEANATFDRTCQALIGIQNDLQVPKDTRTLLDYHIGRLRSLQGILSMRFGRNQQAKPQLEESIQRLEPLIHDESLGQMERLDATHASAGAMSALAMHDLFQGNPDVAKSLQDKAIELIGRQSPTNYEHAMMRVQIHGNMSLIYEQQKEPEKA
jgi:serine/threonine protein kinase